MDERAFIEFLCDALITYGERDCPDEYEMSVIKQGDSALVQVNGEVFKVTVVRADGVKVKR